MVIIESVEQMGMPMNGFIDAAIEVGYENLRYNLNSEHF
jgi:hypothetical protein